MLRGMLIGGLAVSAGVRADLDRAGNLCRQRLLLCRPVLRPVDHRNATLRRLFARFQSADSFSPLTALRDQAYLWAAHPQGIVPQGGRHLGVPEPTRRRSDAYRAYALGAESGLRRDGLSPRRADVAGVRDAGWHHALDGEAAVLGAVAC
jgi:hypothetical protein